METKARNLRELNSLLRKYYGHKCQVVFGGWDEWTESPTPEKTRIYYLINENGDVISNKFSITFNHYINNFYVIDDLYC